MTSKIKNIINYESIGKLTIRFLIVCAILALPVYMWETSFESEHRLDGSTDGYKTICNDNYKPNLIKNKAYLKGYQTGLMDAQQNKCKHENS